MGFWRRTTTGSIGKTIADGLRPQGEGRHTAGADVTRPSISGNRCTSIIGGRYAVETRNPISLIAPELGGKPCPVFEDPRSQRAKDEAADVGHVGDTTCLDNR